jgi:hypothetical protein
VAKVRSGVRLLRGHGRRLHKLSIEVLTSRAEIASISEDCDVGPDLVSA